MWKWLAMSVASTMEMTSVRMALTSSGAMLLVKAQWGWRRTLKLADTWWFSWGLLSL